MATTTPYHLAPVSAAEVSPPYAATWTDTTQAARVRMEPKVLATEGAPLTDKVLNVAITANQYILAYQFVSSPILMPSNLSGVLQIVVRCSESELGINAFLCCNFRATSNDGQTSRGDFIGAGGPTPVAYGGLDSLEFTLDGAPSTRKYIASQYGVTVSKGDRIVIEVGVNCNAPTVSGTATMRFGNSAASDFAITTGLTTDLNPKYVQNFDIMTRPKLLLNSGSLRADAWSPGLAR